MLRHVKLNVPVTRLPALGALARKLETDRIKNIVAPGRLGFTARQSVVFLTTEAAKLFEDLRPDAVIGTATPDQSASASSSTTRPRSSSATTRPRSSTTTSSSSSTTTETSPEESTTSTTDDSDTPVTLFPRDPDEDPEE